jgi:hypothetical protein
MMQAAEPWLCDHATASHCGDSRIRSSFVQPEMCSIFMIVTNAIGEEPFEMSLDHSDDMIEKISPTVADPSFCDSILPRTFK